MISPNCLSQKVVIALILLMKQLKLKKSGLEVPNFTIIGIVSVFCKFVLLFVALMTGSHNLTFAWSLDLCEFTGCSAGVGEHDVLHLRAALTGLG